MNHVKAKIDDLKVIRPRCVIKAATTEDAAQCLLFLIVWKMNPDHGHLKFKDTLRQAVPYATCDDVPLVSLLAAPREFTVYVLHVRLPCYYVG